MDEKSLKQKINSLKKLIKKQTKELHQKYPNHADDMDYIYDPLVKKNFSDRKKIRRTFS